MGLRTVGNRVLCPSKEKAIVLNETGIQPFVIILSIILNSKVFDLLGE